MLVNFNADLEPVPFPRPQSHGKARFNPKRYSDFKDALGYIAKTAFRGQAPFQGEVKLSADFYRPKPKRSDKVSYIGDVDNYLKAVMDSLIGIAYLDDRQVVEIHARKIFGNPHIEIELEELP